MIKRNPASMKKSQRSLSHHIQTSIRVCSRIRKIIMMKIILKIKSAWNFSGKNIMKLSTGCMNLETKNQNKRSLPNFLLPQGDLNQRLQVQTLPLNMRNTTKTPILLGHQERLPQNKIANLIEF